MSEKTLCDLTWENVDEISIDEERYEALIKASTPQDFYFCLESVDDGMTYIAITPKIWFDQYICMWDKHIGLEHIVPDDWYEYREGLFEAPDTWADAKKHLLMLGMTENENLLE
jgi:hypothetical protein